MAHAIDETRDRGGERRPDADIGALAARQHGVVARRQLRAIGLGPDAIDYRLDSGRLHRLHRGVYAVGHSSLSSRGHWMAAVLAAEGAVLSHRSAAALWGIRPSDRIEITVPRDARPRAGVTVHRARLPPDEITVHESIPVTTPARTLLDLASLLTTHHLERAATEAEIRRLTSPTSLADLVARYPNRPGTPKLRKLLEARWIGSAATRSDLEDRFLALLDAEALPRPRTNAVLGGYEVDFHWPGARLVVELDGYATHATRQAFEQDRARDRALQAAGYRVFRVTDRQLTHAPATIVRQLRATLLRRGP